MTRRALSTGVTGQNGAYLAALLLGKGRYYRSTEVDGLLGDASKAIARLGWAPRTSLTEPVAEMAESQLSLARCDALVLMSGYHAKLPQE